MTSTVVLERHVMHSDCSVSEGGLTLAMTLQIAFEVGLKTLQAHCATFYWSDYPKISHKMSDIHHRLPKTTPRLQAILRTMYDGRMRELCKPVASASLGKMMHTLQIGSGLQGYRLFLSHLILDLMLDSRFCSSIGRPVLGAVSYDCQQLNAVVTRTAIRIAMVMLSGLTSMMQCRDAMSSDLNADAISCDAPYHLMVPCYWHIVRCNEGLHKVDEEQQEQQGSRQY